MKYEPIRNGVKKANSASKGVKDEDTKMYILYNPWIDLFYNSTQNIIGLPKLAKLKIDEK